MVLNPGTIVNTEREVILLKAQLKATEQQRVFFFTAMDLNYSSKTGG
jgi:hypothetical protein